MSKKDHNKSVEKALEQLSKSLEFDALNENEAGQLAGGFSEAISESQMADGTINIFKCSCTTTTQPTQPTTGTGTGTISSGIN